MPRNYEYHITGSQYCDYHKVYCIKFATSLHSILFDADSTVNDIVIIVLNSRDW